MKELKARQFLSFLRKRNKQECSDFSIPADTECKLNLHNTFRRRLGRLLNVLRTFNLRPVSTGNCNKKWRKLQQRSTRNSILVKIIT